MLHLYGLTHQKLAGITKYKELKVVKEINVEDILSFLLPVSDTRYSLLQEECYIRTKENEYIIKEIILDDDWATYICKINSEELKGKVIDYFETIEQTCTASLNLLLLGTGWTIGTCDVITVRTITKATCNVNDVLKELQSIYKCEMRFDSINKKIYIYQSMGADRGSYFAEELNLTKLSVQRNSYDYITRLIPIGRDGLDITLVNAGLKYVSNYQYSNKIITAYWEDNRYDVEQDLKDDAIARLEYLSKPYRSYSADIIDLASINPDYTILDYALGDTITLLAKSKSTKEKQRIIKLTQFPEEPERNTCEIANKFISLEDLQVRFEDTSDVVESVTTSDGRLDGTKVNGIDWSQLNNVHILLADIQDLTAVTARIGTLEVNSATITTLNASNARISTLETNSATITNLNASNARINTLETDSATITNLNASNARIVTLETDSATIKTLVAGNIGAANLAAGAIQAGSAIIAIGAIGSAQISALSATKLTAGIIDTAMVTIQGANGRLKLSGNRLQVFAGAAPYERVSIGDVDGDGTVYGFRVRGSDGTTILYDETGVKREGVTDGSINNAKIGADANISGAKLDIASVVTSINGGTTTIQSSKIFLDGNTLDVKFSTLSTTVNNQGTTITNQAASITSLNSAIILKVETSTYNSKMTNLDGSISTINNSLGTHSSSISILEGAIVTKVTQSQVDTSVNNIQIGGRNLISNSSFENGTAGWIYHATPFTIVQEGLRDGKCLKIPEGGTQNGLYIRYVFKAGQQYTFSCWAKTLVNGSSYVGVPQLGALVNIGSGELNAWKFYSTIFTGTDGNHVVYCISFGAGFLVDDIKLELGNKATDWTPAPEEIDARVSTAETSILQNSNSITLKASQTDLTTTNNTVSGINTRLSTAEASLTVQAGQITLKVTQTQVAASINAIQIGGRNLLLNSNVPSTTLLYRFANKAMSEPMIEGQLYTISFKANVVAGRSILVYTNQGSVGFVSIPALTGTRIYSVTFLGVICDNVIELYNAPYGSSSATLTWIKLELGNKATDWTPAPEDIDARISTAETSILQNSNSITLKASQTDLTTTNNTVSGINTRLSTAESSISVQAGQITLKVTQAQVDTSINAIQIGGRNLLLNSKSFSIDYWHSSMFSNWIPAQVTPNFGVSPFGNLEAAKITGLTSNVLTNNISQRIPCLLSTEYTFSIWIKNIDTLSPILIAFSTGLNNVLQVVFSQLVYVSPSSTMWTKYSLRYTTPSVSVNQIEAIVCNIDINKSFLVWGAKLELGNKATDWTPAPEDSPTNANIISTINQTAESITITANKIGLLGAVNIPNLSADKIVGGTLTLGGATYGNGLITMRNDVNAIVGTIDKNGVNMTADIRGGKRFVLPNVIPLNVTEYSSYKFGNIGILFTNNTLLTGNFVAEASIQCQDIGPILHIQTQPILRIACIHEIDIISGGGGINLYPGQYNRVKVNSDQNVSRVFTSTDGAGFGAVAMANLINQSHGVYMLTVTDLNNAGYFHVGIYTFVDSVLHYNNGVCWNILSMTGINEWGTVVFGGGSGNYQYDALYLGG